jgi:hypothetical protein
VRCVIIGFILDFPFLIRSLANRLEILALIAQMCHVCAVDRNVLLPKDFGKIVPNVDMANGF